MSKVKGEASGGLTVGEIIDDRYKVVRLIGQGGNGLVHEVEHVRTGRRLALKSVVEESATARLEQEAKAASLMKNRHVVAITDMGATEKLGPYMVMELLEGQSLRGVLADAGQLSLELTANFALQVCECLEEAHEHGLIHRDLKPDNIFLTPSYGGHFEVKVLDFGVVKVSDDGPIPANSLTRTGSTVGTPFYMSLEQLRNSSNVDARSDVYSLSVVLYECLTGNKPFQADTIGDLVFVLCSGPPTPINRLRPDVPRKVADALMKGLSSKREERPESMRALAEVLADYGDPAFGLWLRSTPTAMGEASAKAIPRPPPPRPPAPKAASPGPPPSPASPPAGKNSPLLDESSTAVDVVSEPSRTGDRDTPTELYVKDLHGAKGPSEPDGTGQRDTPTESIDPAEFAAQQAKPAGQNRRHPSSTVRMSQDAAKEAIQAALAPTMPTPPAEISLPLADTVPQPAPVTDMPLPEARPPAGVKGKMDNLLNTVGGGLERALTTGGAKFKAASPNMQIVVVIITASVLAVLLVLLVYAAVSSEEVPPEAPSSPPAPAAAPK